MLRAPCSVVAPSGPEKEMFRIKCYRKDLRPDFCASHALPLPSPIPGSGSWGKHPPVRLQSPPPPPRASHPATCFMIIYELSPLKYKCCVYELSFSDCKCKCASSVCVCVCVLVSFAPFLVVAWMTRHPLRRHHMAALSIYLRICTYLF